MPNTVTIKTSDGRTVNLDRKRYIDHYDDYVSQNEGAKVAMYDANGKESYVALKDARASRKNGLSYDKKRQQAQPADTKSTGAGATSAVARQAGGVGEQMFAAPQVDNKPYDYTRREERQFGYQPQAAPQMGNVATRMNAENDAKVRPDLPYVSRTAGDFDKKVNKDVDAMIANAVKEGDEKAQAAVQASDAKYADARQMAPGFSEEARVLDIANASDRTLTANMAKDPVKMLNGLTGQMEEYINGHADEVIDNARAMGVSVEDYVDRLRTKMISRFEGMEEAKYMPKNDFDYIIGGIKNWIPMMLTNTASTGQEYYRQRAEQKYSEQLSGFGGGLTTFGKTAVEFADPAFGGTFKAGTMLGKGVYKVGEKAVGKVAERLFGKEALTKAGQYATRFGSNAEARMAQLVGENSKFMDKLGQIAARVPEEVVSQGVAMQTFGTVQSIVNEYDTDASPLSIGEVAWESLTNPESFKEGAMFGMTMPFLHGFAPKGFGANATRAERWLNRGKQVGYEIGSVLATAGVMELSHEGLSPTINGYMGEVAVAAAMKYNPGNLQQLRGSIGKFIKGGNFEFTPEEAAEIMEVTGTSKMSDALRSLFPDGMESGGRATKEQVNEAQTKFLSVMNRLSWDAQNKLAMGLTNSYCLARPRTHTFEYDGDVIVEKDKDGNVLSRKEIKNADERAAYLQEKKMFTKNMDILNAYADGMRVGDGVESLSDIQVSFVASMYGKSVEDVRKALFKEPVRRTEEEGAMLNDLYYLLRGESHKLGEVGIERSMEEGAHIADDADVLGETPRVDLIAEVNTDLTNAETAFSEALGDAQWKDDYAVRKEQGLTDEEIYNQLLELGYNVPELAPLANYINAKATQEGLMGHIGAGIDSRVSERMNLVTGPRRIVDEAPANDNIIHITDKDGNDYILVDGTITSKEDGGIESDQPIMVMDANGEVHARDAKEFMQGLVEKAGEYQARYEEELGLKATAVVDPNGELDPANKPDNPAAKLQGTVAEQQGAVALSEEQKETGNAPVEEEKKGIPTNEEGEPIYTAAGVRAVDAVDDIYNNQGLSEADADAYINNNIEAIKKEREKHDKKKPKMGSSLAKFRKDSEEWKKKADELQHEADAWNAIKEEADKFKKPEQVVDAETLSGLDLTDLEGMPELTVAMNMPKITPESFKRETGGAGGDMRSMPGFIASKEKGGKSVEEAAEWITQFFPEGTPYADDTVVRNIVIDIINAGGPRSYIKELRERLAQEEADRIAYEQEQEEIYQTAKHRAKDYDEAMQMDDADRAKYRGMDFEAYDKARDEAFGKENDADNQPGELADTGEPSEKRQVTGFSLSDEKADKGGAFYKDANGNVNLVEIPHEVFEKIQVDDAPFRMTESMADHVLKRHGAELGIKTKEEAVKFVVDVMTNFDHVRQGDDAFSYIFSVENGRNKTGKRAITIIINNTGGDYLGIKTSGYERVESLTKRPLLWEKGAKETSATDATSANVTNDKPIESGEPNASASNQSNGFENKGTKKNPTAQEGSQNLTPKSEYGAKNKFVTKEKKAELMARLREKMNRANSGIDPELLEIGTELAMYHMEAGAHKFADFVREMVKDLRASGLGEHIDKLKGELKSWYAAASVRDEFDDIADNFDERKAIKATDVDALIKEIGEVGDNHEAQLHDTKTEEAKDTTEAEKKEPQQLDMFAENATEESKRYAEGVDKRRAYREAVTEALRKSVEEGGERIKSINELRKLAKEHGLEDMKDTDLQELVESAIVDVAREYARDGRLDLKGRFDKIRKLYESQPSLNQRDTDRIMLQQYSTPAPMAYLLDAFVDPDGTAKSGLEPSAGNGMLTIGLDKGIMHVNDIDEMRLSNLQSQGFGKVTNQDGTQPFGEKQYDVVVTNPPFGSATPREYDGYTISGLEHQMAINALMSMKDGGRAAIIIGGNTEYQPNGAIKGRDKAFMNYLYSHYNVVDVINMDGKKLYSRQGTGYDVRMILIDGRKEFDKKSYAPVEKDARAEKVTTYDELFNRVNDDILRNRDKSADIHNEESGEGNRGDNRADGRDASGERVRNVHTGGRGEQPELLAGGGRDVPKPVERRSADDAEGMGRERTESEGGKSVDNRPAEHDGGREQAAVADRQATGEADGGRGRVPDNGRDGAERRTGKLDESVGVGQRGSDAARTEPVEEQRKLGAEKVPYRQQSSNPFSLNSLMPAEQADQVKATLEELGDVDSFVAKELGYSSIEELHKGLAAEQVDSVAMAIHQMNQGNAFIIGDQTGIGKGRQAAALIRYGVKKGGCPVFVTVKKGLFSDMYRDLCDIGSPELRPFIWAADDTVHSANVTDAEGNLVHELPSKKEQQRVVEYINKHGKLPKEYDYVLTTYDAFKSGTHVYENGEKKERKWGKKQNPNNSIYKNGQAKRDAFEALAANSYVIMDESHNAGGEGSNVSGYLQYITTKSKGTTFLSATFAKRPGNMPIYSLRTAISKANVKIDELIDAVKRGGATFQEVMSKALTQAGQMVRRERDMTGVTIDWKGIEDETVIQQQREQYDKVIGLFNKIIDFQRKYVDPIIDELNDAAAAEQAEVDHTPGTRDMGINNTPFASRTYNMVQQVLLSLKAEESAKRAIEHLKEGRKVVIAVANTNEGASGEASVDGEEMSMPDLSINLKKGLQGVLRYTTKSAEGDSSHSSIPVEKLGEEGMKRYGEIMDEIENASSGLSLSPIDVMKNELRKAGYRVGELTGREKEFAYNENGTVTRVKRADTDKKRTAAQFNNGELDVLILNRSAGTGISLHASSKFKDQRQRVMIVAQAQGDVNDEVQIRGRIDRTGQVYRGMYEYVVSQIPSEQRLLMMLKSKLRSLDANTTSSQKSKFNEMDVQDVMNKYGDQILIQYLAENPAVYEKLADPLGWGDDIFGKTPEELVETAKKADGDGATASKVLGRMALLTVKEQEAMLDDISALYENEINRLNDMGENDLEITEMPLKAKTVKKSIWEAGTEPDTHNPFADHTYIEEVEMDVLVKPMKSKEVKKAQESMLQGKTFEEFKAEKVKAIEDYAADKEANLTAEYEARAKKHGEAAAEKVRKEAQKNNAKAQKANDNPSGEPMGTMSEEEIEKLAKVKYDEAYDGIMLKYEVQKNALNHQKRSLLDVLEMFSTDKAVVLPEDIYDLGRMSFDTRFGKLIGMNLSSNFSASASTVTFATLDGRRKVVVPFSGMVKGKGGEKHNLWQWMKTNEAHVRAGVLGKTSAEKLRALESNPENWDRLVSTNARKKGAIVTGNLLQALVSTRKQGLGGKLISYTTDRGEVRQGLLMSDTFDIGKVTRTKPLTDYVDRLIKNKEDVVSSDGKVTLSWAYSDAYYIDVPKSTKEGGKYFTDEKLLGMVEDGEFSTKGGKMRAMVGKDKVADVMKRLGELGVTAMEKGVEGEEVKDRTHYDFAEDIDIESVKGLNDVKKALIIPKELENSVTSQNIEAEFEKELEEALAGAGGSARYHYRMALLDASEFARTPMTDGFRYVKDANGRRVVDKDGRYVTEKVEGLTTIISKLREEKERLNQRLNENEGKGSLESVRETREDGEETARENSRRLAVCEREIAYREYRLNKLAREWEGKIGSNGEVTLDTLKEMYDAYKRDNSQDGLVDILLDKLRNDVEIKLGDASGMAVSTLGTTEFDGRIKYNIDAAIRSTESLDDLADTIEHELVHAGLGYMISAYNAGGEYRAKLTEGQRKNVKELLDFYDSQIKNNPRFKELYAGEDEHELASEVGAKELRDVLTHIGVWDKFVNLLKRLANSIYFKATGKDLGLKEKEAEREQLERIVSELAESYNTEIHKEIADEIGVYISKVSEAKQNNGAASRLIDEKDPDLTEDDKKAIGELNSGKTKKVYRAMQVIDGKLYPPMAARVGGKLVEGVKGGEILKADEHPELIKMDKSGKPQFVLDKGGKDATGKKAGDVPARYNPYWHTSNSMLNDQFKSAWIRPNMVVVEVEIPEMELTSGYKAEYAKDAVGKVEWKSGIVTGQLVKQGHPGREVYLSRYCKIGRVVPEAEVAENIKAFMGGRDVEIPINVVTPKLREALEEAGVKIGAPEKGVKMSEQIQEALERGLEVDNSIRFREDVEGGSRDSWEQHKHDVIVRRQRDFNDALKKGDEAMARINLKGIAEMNGYTYEAWHGSPNADITEFVDGHRSKRPEHSLDEVAEAGWFTNSEDGSKRYGGGRWGGKSYHVFIRMQKPLHIYGDAEAAKNAKNTEGYRRAEAFWKLDSLATEAKEKYPDAKTKGEAMRMMLKEHGYDGVILHDTVADGAEGETWYLPTDAGNNIKSAELITKDNNGRVIPIEERFTDSTDIRYRTGGREAQLADTDNPAVKLQGTVAVRELVEKLSKKLNTKFNLHDSAEDVEDAKVKKALAEGRKVMGWYDTKTGEVHLYMPNIHSAHEAEKTILHETVAHKGLREVFGEEGYNRLMRNLWENLGSDVRKAILGKAKRNGWKFYEALDEYIASEAEKEVMPENMSLWNKVRYYLEKTVRELGYNFRPNLTDTRYLMWLSKNHLKKGDVISKMRQVAMRRKLMRERIKPVVVDGMYYGSPSGEPMGTKKTTVDTEGAVAGETLLRAIEDDRLTPMGKAVVDEYNGRVASKMSKTREAFVDNMESVRILQEEIIGKGNDVKDSENAYIAENQMSSIAETRWEKFRVQKYAKLEDAISACVGEYGGDAKATLKEVEVYAYKKHGLERNRVMWVDRAIKKLGNSATADDLRSKFADEKAKAMKEYKEGKIGFGEYISWIDEWIHENLEGFESNKVDYSGISAFDEKRKKDGKDVEYDEEQIINDVIEAEGSFGKDRVDAIWSAIKDCTDFSLDYAWESGEMNKDVHDGVKSMYDFYIPLRGFAEQTMEDIYEYMYGKGSGEDGVLKDAKGRMSLAESPFAHISSMAKTAILAGERNKVLQKFYRLNVNHKNDAVSIGEVWEVKDGTNADGTERWTMKTALDLWTEGNVSTKAVEKFEAEMKELEAKGEARIATDKLHAEANFRNKLNANEHAVRVKVNGKTKMMYINGDPRAAQALNGKLANDSKSNTNRVTRWLMNTTAKLATSYSPEFILSNTSRDTLFANANIASKENAAYLAKFTANQAAAMRLVFTGIGGDKMNGESLFEKFYRGREPKDHTERMFFEFMDNGGRTGFVAQQDIAEYQKELQATIKDGRATQRTLQLLKSHKSLGVGDVVEEMNMRAELINRFAAYKTSREMGRSVMRSVDDAKNVSVNFNRHGSGSAGQGMYGAFAGYFRNNYMFFNAGMQSLELMYQNVKGVDAKTAKTITFMGAIPVAAGYALASLLASQDDEKYSNIPSWDRRNNICIPIKEGYVKIPLPIELRAFWGMGDVLASLDYKRLQTEESPAFAMAGQITQALPIDFLEGGETHMKFASILSHVAPTAVRPLFQYLINENWTGKPIHRESKFNPDAPAWTLAYDSTNKFIVEFCKWGHDVTRNGENTAQETDTSGLDVDPTLIEHILKSYMSGAYSILGKGANFASDLTEGDVNISRSPMLSRLVGEFSDKEADQTTNAKYWSYRREAENTYKETRNPANRRNPLAVEELRNSPEYKRMLIYKRSEAFMNALNKAIENSEGERKAYLQRMKKEKMRDIVDAMDAIE